jgi:CRP/FNR family cyclic AMP-dependent transcriptional regulator
MQITPKEDFKMPVPGAAPAAESCDICKLRKNGFFCHLSGDSLKDFDTIRFTNHYPQGASLFMEGESPRGIFILCSGRVKISMTSADGRTAILRIALPGEVLGLHAAVSNTPYQASAQTLEPCQLNFVRRPDFLRFLNRHGEASLRAALQLSENYQTACEQIRALGLAPSASAKVAMFLLDWANHGQETGQGIRTRLTLTHEEIGQMVGASRETVTRTLTDFRCRRLAVIRGSTLLIQDREGLERMVLA